MDLKIEDYLHFYIGVPILICEPGTAPVYHYELEGYDKALNKAIAERVNYPPEWIKPILYKPEDNDWIRHVPCIPPLGDFNWISESLKNGVDLFGLIDAGLAVWRKEINKEFPDYTRVHVSPGPHVYQPNKLDYLLSKIDQACRKWNKQ